MVSSILLWRECRVSPSTRMTTEWKTVRLYPIPSIIYLIHNNVQFATLTYVDTSTYQIMGNLKIVTTGILFRCAYIVFFEVTYILMFYDFGCVAFF
jgi:UDP-sugar transporter A1/2/3